MPSTAEPDNIKAMLTNIAVFELSPRAEMQPSGPFSVTESSPPMAKNGKLSSTSPPQFIRSQVLDLDTLETHISKLILENPRDRSTVDLQKLFFMLTFDTATEFLFWHSTDTLGIGSEKGVMFAEAFTYATTKAGLQARIGKLVNIFRDKDYTDAITFINEYFSSYVQKAVELYKTALKGEKVEHEAVSIYVFLEHLAKTNYGEKKIQDQLLNILLAGCDTTASFLSFLFHVLARGPDVFSKLRAEVMELGNKRPTFEQVKSMKYLQWYLNESEC
jgi:cytochrome P450